MPIAGTTATTHLPFPELLKAHRDQLAEMPGWRGVMSREEAEELLQGKSPLTYVVRDVGEADAFELSWVMKTGAIKHRDARLIENPSTGSRYWKNHTVESFLNPVTADENALLELFSKMMECDPNQMRPA